MLDTNTRSERREGTGKRTRELQATMYRAGTEAAQS
jgi:hypothetical protein